MKRTSAKRSWRLLGAVALVPLLILGTAAYFQSNVAAQKPPSKSAKPEEQEEPAKKPAKKPPKPEEVEEPDKKPKKKLPKVDDDKPSVKTTDRSQPGKTTYLAKEAEAATNPVVKELFLDLAVPHDVITHTERSNPIVTAPVAPFVGPRPARGISVKVVLLGKDWKEGQSYTLHGPLIAGIDHYEQIILRRVEGFLDKSLDKEPSDSPRYLSRLEMLRAAEKVLTAGVLFHKSAVETGRRKGQGWSEWGDKLAGKLLAVQLLELQTLIDPKKLDNFGPVFALAEELAQKYPDTKVRQKLAQQLAPFVERALQDENFKEVQLRMKVLDQLFPNDPALAYLNQKLRDRAEQFLKDAQKAREAKDIPLAMGKLDIAVSIYPRLPGASDLRIQMSDAYPMLRVGVERLPKYMTPSTACTDSERQAVELLFESLVKATTAPRSLGDVAERQSYFSGLSVDRPRLIPLGRLFQLDPEAYWSNNKRVTAADVRGTVQLLQKAGAETAIAEVRPGNDAFQVGVTLKQGLLDPLSAMTFKILPADSFSDKENHPLAQADDKEFAAHPVGSGPYVYWGEDNGEAVFNINASYRRKPGKPFFWQIRFFHSDNPQKDFEERKLDLLLDLPTKSLQELKSVGGIRTHTLPNRRIYFLAVNHRKLIPPQEENLPLAIGLAINRTKILDDVFRDGQPVHRPLNGPYPPGSWAALSEAEMKARNLKVDPFDFGRASLLKVKITRPRQLKYPTGDERVREACTAIAEQVKPLGIELELVPRTPHELRDDVEKQSYDLAYYSFDFDNEAYNLEPLLGFSRDDEPGNFLGYKPDALLLDRLAQARNHRRFEDAQKFAHEVHQRVYEVMPFIPLWQLDTHIAIHNDVEAVYVDPLRVFTHIEEWKKRSSR